MQLKEGVVDGSKAVSPLLIATVPFGLVLGIVAAESSVGPVLGYATSIIIFAGAAQLATIQLLDEGIVAAVVVATALVINSRHLMYSAALAPHFREFPRWARYVLPYVLTDQAFAVSIVRYNEVTDPAYKRRFFTGAALTLWGSWQLATFVGIVVGAQLPQSLSLDFTIPLVFVALLVLTVRSRPELVAALVGGGIAVLAAPAPYGLGLIIGALGGIAAGVAAHRITS
ncbi:MAG: AzlC family ABC transporter permease [Acidimicrobiia bacterium]|nr:MAG: AzlC family ABC transporter permease [Acidimicrobiia bacterium]